MCSHLLRWLAMFWRVRPLPAVPMPLRIWLGTAWSTPMLSTTDEKKLSSSAVHSTCKEAKNASKADR